MKDNDEPYVTDRIDTRDKQEYERDSNIRRKRSNWLPLLLIPLLLIGAGLLVVPRLNDSNKIATTQQTSNETSVTEPAQTNPGQRTAGQSNTTTNVTPSAAVTNSTTNTTNGNTNTTDNTQNGPQVGIGGAPGDTTNTTMPNSPPATGRGGL